MLLKLQGPPNHYKMSEFCNVLKLTTDNYKEIFHASSQELRKTILLASLGIEELDEEDELRKSIVLDFCLDIVSFSSNQGFSWENVHRAVSFGVRLLDETACKGKFCNQKYISVIILYTYG